MSDDDNGEHPNGDYMDVCDSVLDMMCDKCTRHTKCMQPDEDGDMVNHDMMEQCLGHLPDRIAGTYPDEAEVEADPDGEATGCCENVADAIQEVMCPNCPLYGTCMPDIEADIDHEGDVVNYNQMVVCMGSIGDRLEGKYPETVKCPWITGATNSEVNDK